MPTYIPALLGVVVSIVVGAILAVITLNKNENARVDLPELLLGSFSCLLICLGVVHFGDAMAISNKIDGYRQYLNGNMVEATSSTTNCDINGSCSHTYVCNSHMVTDYDSEGKASGSHEEHDDCPYATQEFSYHLKDSLDDTHTVASHIFAANPKRWNGWEAEGSGFPDNVDRGVPAKWQEVKDRIAAGDPPSMTAIGTYTNLLLGSDSSLLKRYSPNIEKFKKAKLLPPHTSDWQDDPLHGGWTADKFQVVGGLPVASTTWNASLMRFNAAFGSLRRGDVHMVAVPASKVNNPQSYANALIAYWQGPEFGKDSLAKNGVAIIIGLSDGGQRVEWVRAKIGMPTGENAGMVSALEAIKGVPFKPQSFLGHPKAILGGKEVRYTTTGGLVETIMITDRSTQYLRPCMECKDKSDHGRPLTYLKSEVTVPHSVKVWEFIIAFVLCTLVWVGLYFFPVVSTVLGSRREPDEFQTNPGRRFGGYTSRKWDQ